MSAANVHLRWAELVTDGLARAGVRHAVISPGSRSTPLVLALARRAELQITVVVDERVAAFFALGQARATGVPSLLVCTSGTAAAHFLPAMIEADEAGVPLVVLTADRPPELHHRQAAQTTDQRNLFAGRVRLFADLGIPDADLGALRGVRITAALAVARALGPRPGPVHLNVPFRKPLEPVTPTSEDATLIAVVNGLAREPLPRAHAPVAEPDADALCELAALLRRTARGVILAGAGPLGQREVKAWQLATRLGYPLLAETTSQLRWGRPEGAQPFDLLAPDPRVSRPEEPEIVLQLGSPVVSAAWQRYFEGRPGCTRWVLGGHGWPDPWGGASGLVAGDLVRTVELLLGELGAARPVDGRWEEAWQCAAKQVTGVVDSWRAEESGRGELSELGAAWVVIEALRRKELLVVGNSLAVREVDLVPTSAAPGVGILHQRGVAGIDGLIAGAAGAASVSGRPTVALVGDLAVVHDLGALAAAREVSTPLVIVVLSNRGGRIFELLPLVAGGVDEVVIERFFLTPVEIDLESAARTFRVPFGRARTGAELGEALRAALASPGPRLIEALISGPGARARWTALGERSRAARS